MQAEQGELASIFMKSQVPAVFLNSSAYFSQGATSSRTFTQGLTCLITGVKKVK